MPFVWKIDISLQLYSNIIKYKNNKEKLLKLIQENRIPYNDFIIVSKSCHGYDLYPFGYLTVAKFVNKHFT